MIAIRTVRIKPPEAPNPRRRMIRPRYDGASDPDDDVHHRAEAFAFHNSPCCPTCDQSDDNPPKNQRHCCPFPRSRCRNFAVCYPHAPRQFATEMSETKSKFVRMLKWILFKLNWQNYQP